MMDRYQIPAALLFSAMAISGSAALAQVEVVQPQPTAKVAALNSALQRLALNPQSVDALIQAGNAALELGDIDAAIGFFGRADSISPGHPLAKLGMAAGFMRSERPIEALRLFSEAEKSGVSSAALAGDRGLAYDLVGDNRHAQEQYRVALARGLDDELTRRLALSLAISGDEKEFEKTLLPLLQRRDLAAYRARAFGLAILGKDKDAQRIADAVMPKAMASQLEPYLRYMPQLTRSQQAAAANFGRFPQANLIGRDDPRLAQYARPATAAPVQAGAKLQPQGTPLDQQVAKPAPTRVAIGSDPAALAKATPLAKDQIASPAPTPSPTQTPKPTAGPVQTVSAPVIQPSPKVAAELAAAPSVVPGTAQGNLAQVVAQQGQPKPPTSIEVAFSDFNLPTSAPATQAGNAVDITRIAPRREVAPPPAPPKRAKPKAPSRIWVQVATGKDLAALKFDWRKLQKKAPEQLGKLDPRTVPWGEANRLLAGPYASDEEARKVMKALKEKGISTFAYTSPEGQDIAALK